MGYHVVKAGDHVFEERPNPTGQEDQIPRLASDLTTAAALKESRARLWRYSPGTRGRRHADQVQEEVFVVLSGTLTMLLGEPPEQVELPPEASSRSSRRRRFSSATTPATRSSSSSTARRRSRAEPTSSTTPSPRRRRPRARRRPPSRTRSPRPSRPRARCHPPSNSPSRSRFASGFSTSRWNARFSGLAP